MLTNVVGCLIALAALPSPGAVDSHRAYLQRAEAARQQSLTQALAIYDTYLAAHPQDTTAACERCDLIGPTDDEDDGPNDAQQDCRDDLSERFPDSATVTLYLFDRALGTERIAVGERALERSDLVLSDSERASVHLGLATTHRLRNESAEAIREARLALVLDPTIDASQLLAPSLVAQGRSTEAIAMLSARTDLPTYRLVENARQLEHAGGFARALWVLQTAEQRPAATIDPLLYGRVLEDLGRLPAAREKYAHASGRKRAEVQEGLFDLDVTMHDRVAASASYGALRDRGWKADPLAAYRLRLFRLWPRLRWSARDLAGLGGLLAMLLGVALMPLLLVAPLHYHALTRRRAIGCAPRWQLRHVWAALAITIVTQLLAIVLFDPDMIAEIIEQRPLDSSLPAIAATGVCGIVLSAVGMLGLLRMGDVRWMRGSWSIGKSAAAAFSACAFVFACAGLWMTAHKHALLGIDDVLRAVGTTYGIGTLIAIAVFIGPMVEEIVFRSVVLDTLRIQMPFAVANTLQAALFAAAHVDLGRAPILFTLGLLCGVLRRRSHGLLSPMLLHAFNNAIAVAVLWHQPSASLAADRPAPTLVAMDQLSACRPTAASQPAATTKPKPLATQYNDDAWAIATHPATEACLRIADTASQAALELAPANGAVLDTRATILALRGRLSEAIDIERVAFADRSTNFVASQLDRFVSAAERGAPVSYGIARPGAIALALETVAGQRQIHAHLDRVLDEALVALAHVRDHGRDLGLFSLSLSPGNAHDYHLAVETNTAKLPDTATFDLALVDTRGCDHCARGAWRWHYNPHDPAADKLPPIKPR